jgi:nitroimidazol reductase NimA-like FMN-containing flavoprotein (pyridoxamine 5'-phosphate oxidase superfamily)
MTEPPSDRTTVKRKPERADYDRTTVDRILDEGLICHAGFSSDGQTFVIPMIHVRIGDKVYLHGAPASRTLRALADGAEVCLTVTLIDGLVLARSAMHHSMNYRSVVLFGRASPVDDPAEKRAVLQALTDHLVPGRWADVRGPNDRELQRTRVVSVPIQEASAKIRTGPPVDDEADYDLPVWAGVVPLRLAPDTPIADPRLKPGVQPPGYAAHYHGPRGVPPRAGD